MAVAFQVVLLIVPWVRGLWGAGGVLTSAAVFGLTDMDALTYSMARVGTAGDPALAARAILHRIRSATITAAPRASSPGAAALRNRGAPRNSTRPSLRAVLDRRPTAMARAASAGSPATPTRAIE